MCGCSRVGSPTLNAMLSSSSSSSSIEQSGGGIGLEYVVSDKVRVISSNNDDEQYIRESATGRSFTEQKDTEMAHEEVK